MNLFKKFLISIFLIILLMNTAYGFPGMGGNNTTITQNMTIPQETAIQKPQDLKNATESDQDIIMAQHLIEFDAVQLLSENKLLIKETLTFKNVGTKDYYGSLRTWLPDSSDNIKVSRSEMMAENKPISLDFEKNGNIISWKEFVEKNSVKFLYIIEYTIVMEPGASSITGIFSKKLAYPTLINYRYVEIRSDLAPLVVKIIKPQESSIEFFDENRNEIKLNVDETGDIYRGNEPPQFKELNIRISGSSAIPAIKNNYVVYVVLGILIILVLLYPTIKKKLKPGESYEYEGKKETSSSSEVKPQEDILESDDSKGLLKGLKDLEMEYKSGDLLDEEYEEKKKSIQNKIKAINRRSK